MPNDQTWEPAQNVTNAHELIREIHGYYPDKPGHTSCIATCVTCREKRNNVIIIEDKMIYLILELATYQYTNSIITIIPLHNKLLILYSINIQVIVILLSMVYS